MSATAKVWDDNSGIGAGLAETRKRALDVTDKMPPHLRLLVHEYGLPIIETCVKHGVTNPGKIRELIRDIWAGARHPGQSGSAHETLDWLLMQAGANISAKKLRRFLADNNLVICSTEPTRPMLDASMAEVSGHNIRCTREEKHRLRLRAALRKAMEISIK